MKRNIFKTATVGAVLLMMAGTLTGCGKKEVDVMAGIEVDFSGVEGYGTARIANTDAWEESAFEAAGIKEKLDADSEEVIEATQAAFVIEEAVRFEISPTENLSNGDVVTVTAVVDNESVEGYKIAFIGDKKTFTVEGLKEVEQIDLFDGVTVEFEGFAPYVKASINDKHTNSDIYVTYSLDRSENLAMGDIVTVTAEYDEESLLQKGYMAEENTKEFVVDECDRYVTQLVEIPNDTISKMNKQFEDAFQAYVAKDWENANYLNSIEHIGNYLLTAKEGENAGDKNICYGIYKISVSTEEEEFVYYSYCRFNNIIILKDGTSSVDLTDYKMPEGSVFSKRIYSGDIFWRGNYFYIGYETLDSLFNNCVTQNIEKYEYESNVKE